ncbi:O-antigen ligase family protein [Pseudomonadales bacterium]|nr:O-antigen ligase family protein [Pseudomonadales bacterium]
MPLKYSSNAKANLISKFVFLQLSFYLVVDSLNGYMMLGLGVDAGLSALYKSVLLTILLIYLSVFLPKRLLFLLAAICLLSLGEIASIFLLDTNGSKISFLFQHILKVLTPLILLFFLIDRLEKDRLFFVRILTVIQINGLVFLCNMLAGAFGLGFSTYGQGGENAIGSKGYFYAGNELSALLVVFGAFYLARAYLNNKFHFIVLAILSIAVGLLVSTKTSMLAVVLLIIIMPVLYEGRRLFLLNNIPSIIFALTLSTVLVQALVIFEAFTNAPVYSRFLFFFERHGLAGLLLSGRDTFLTELWLLFSQKDLFLGFLFGHGVSYYAEFTKYSVEMDFLDMFFWHGLSGVFVLLIVFFHLSYKSWINFSDKTYPFARIILVTNMMLLAISNFSGHIFTSGMLAFIWPCFVMLAYYDPRRIAVK